jgi:Rhodopirellula transposase DDE domain
VGLAEKRTSIVCLSLHEAFSGRRRWEEQYPEAAAALMELALGHSQQDPTFRTTVSYTRLTAKTAIEGLRQQGIEEALLPAPSTMAVILNRLGFRLRNVVKSKPLKKVPETDAIFANVKKKTRKPSQTAR